MDISSTYSMISAGWLALQAVPLLLTPSMIIKLMSENDYISALEVYLSRSLALSLLALSSSELLLSGVIPVSVMESEATAYYGPITLIATIYHFSTAFLAYTSYTFTNQTAYALGMVGAGTMAAAGTWCLLFGGEKERVSKRTGKDKRTSAWPFGDKKGRAEELKEN